MWGTIVNILAILGGASLGKIIGQGLKENFRIIVMQAIGLGVLLVGLQMAFKTSNVILVLISLVLGGIIGETIRLEYWLERLGKWLENKVAGGEKTSLFAKGFVSASLLYCVGAMAIMGSLESGLTGKHTTLYAKSLLDGVSAIILASTMGWGVAFSALPVFVYQGSITLLAGWIGQFLTEAVVNEMTAVGGLLIFAIGLNLLGIKEFRVGNLLPSILVVFILTVLLTKLGVA